MELARARPARNPPISIEKPIHGVAIRAARPSPQAILKRKSTSCERPMASSTLGKTLRERKIETARRAPPLRNDKNTESITPQTEASTASLDSPAKNMSARMAKKSCTKRNPTTILPYKLLRSFFSESRRTTMTVDEKVRAMDI